jgi:hypothetical protein
MYRVRFYAVLVTTMVLSLAIGIFVSTFSRHERKAMVYTILALVGVTFVLPYFAMTLVMNFAPFSDAAWIGVMFSPGFGALLTLGLGLVAPSSSFWFSVLWQWLLAAALIARACAHVSRSWEESGLGCGGAGVGGPGAGPGLSRTHQGHSWKSGPGGRDSPGALWVVFCA